MLYLYKYSIYLFQTTYSDFWFEIYILSNILYFVFSAYTKKVLY